jgi:integrase
MIQVQRLTGCRPQDVVQMRARDIDTAGAVWEYRPPRYKGEHHNDDGDPDLDRVVYLGPRAQDAVRPFLTADPDAYLFSPRQSEAARLAELTAARKWDAGAEGRSSSSRSPLRPHYPVGTYRQAIRRACLKAGIPVWKPNQLRHARRTEIRGKYGLEASRVVGGHREVGVTQIYAEQDRTLARQVMAEVG